MGLMHILAELCNLYQIIPIITLTALFGIHDL